MRRFTTTHTLLSAGVLGLLAAGWLMMRTQPPPMDDLGALTAQAASVTMTEKAAAGDRSLLTAPLAMAEMALMRSENDGAIDHLEQFKGVVAGLKMDGKLDWGDADALIASADALIARLSMTAARGSTN